jgi:DNA-directed RNA polymerase subunit F
MTTIDEQEAVQTQPEVVRVPSAEDMDLVTFCRHMTLRHADSLGGMSKLDPEKLSPYVEDLYRIFHDRIHDGTLFPGRQFDHVHKAPR